MARRTVTVADPSPSADDAPEFVVAVRALCEFAARSGDLDLRFTPAPTAEQGMAGHAQVTAGRGPGYQTEFPLAGRCGPLLVRGRADGWDVEARCLEEIKTHRGDLSRQGTNQRALHWAQARVYGWLACERHGLASVELALVYLDIDSDTVTRVTETAQAEDLRAVFESLCTGYIAWMRQERQHRLARDAALATLAFPLPEMRAGQRELAGAVYRVARAGRALMAQAPTGIGKTLGTLFPMLRAAGSEGLDKVFWLSARTTGRRLALDAAEVMLGADATGGGARPLRVLELVARDKACEHPDKACHGESCPLARGFWDRLPAARAEAVASPAMLDKAALRGLALRHGVCPYYLGQELARWADLVVGDYNHWFDGPALLHAWALDQGWRVGLLVDEAHNLVDRARAMYSGALDAAELQAVRRGTAAGPLRRALDRLARHWRALEREAEAPYTVFDDPPAPLAEAVRKAAAEATEALADPARGTDPALQALAFDLIHFAQRLDGFGPHALFDLTLSAVRPGRSARSSAEDRGGASAPSRVHRTASVLCVRNLVPAPHLRARWQAARCAVLFSATLSPREYHADLLGLPEERAWIDLPTPFASAQLGVHVARRISTRWRDREASIAPIVERVGRQFAERPGLYLAFFSSYDYLERVFDAFVQASPAVPAWAQQRGMTEPARDAFLARFQAGQRGVGFAVLGGAFAEGIDLPGERLVGAFVATLGLPQVNPVNERMRERIEQLFPGRGDDYTYLYPGLQKVVQAAGRVIRTPADEGVLHLLDDRFGQARVRALLPGWWGLRG